MREGDEVGICGFPPGLVIEQAPRPCATQRIRETVVNISGLTVMAHNSEGITTAATASSTLRLNAERWQQITKDVAREVQPYRDGWQSYTFHLGQTIDNSLSK